MKIVFYTFLFLTTICVAAQPNNWQAQYTEIRPALFGWHAVSQGNLWGVVDTSGKIIAPVQYNTAQVASLDCDVVGLVLDGNYCFLIDDSLHCYNFLFPFKNGIARIYHQNKIGLIASNGREILPPKYDFILDEWKYNLLGVYINEKMGYLNRDYKMVIPPIYDSYGFSDTYPVSKVLQNNKYGLIDTLGQFIAPAIYDSLQIFTDSTYVARLNNKMGVLDYTGKPIVPFVYDSIGFEFTENQHYYKIGVYIQNGKYGLMHRNSSFITPPIYDTLYQINKNWGISKNNKYGILDTLGHQLVPFIYDKPIKNDIFYGMKWYQKVCQNDKWGIVDSSFRLLIPIMYDQLNYDSQHIVAKQNGKMGFIDLENNIVVPILYDVIFTINANIYATIENNTLTLYNKITKKTKQLGIEVDKIVAKYDNQFVIFSKNGLLGAINLDGQLVVPCDNDEITYQNGVFIVAKHDKIGFIYCNGKVALPTEYDANYQYGVASAHGNVSYFDLKSSWILIRKNGKAGFIDQQGNVLIPPTLNYRFVLPFRNSIYAFINEKGKIDEDIFVKGGTWGLIDRKGNELLAPIYEYIYEQMDSSLVICLKDSLCGYCDRTGKIILKPNYLWVVKWQNILFAGTPDATLILNAQGDTLHRLSKQTHPLFDYLLQRNTLATISVEQNGKWALIDRNGKLLTPFKYAEIGYLGNNYFRYNIGLQINLCELNPDARGKWGIMDSSGNELTKAIYTTAFMGKNKEIVINIGAIIEKGYWVGGKWGLITPNGKELLPMEYNMLDYQNGYYIFRKLGQKTALMNANHRQIIKPVFEQISADNIALSKLQRFWVKQDTLWYLYDARKNRILSKGYQEKQIKPSYGHITLFTTIINNNQSFWVDANGKEITKLP